MYRLRVLAVVADEPFRRAVVGEADAAVRADGHVPAGAALDEARVAAPIEEQDALLALRETVAKGGLQRRCDGEGERRVGLGGVRRPTRRTLLAQVHHVHEGQLRAAGALGEGEQL